MELIFGIPTPCIPPVLRGDPQNNFDSQKSHHSWMKYFPVPKLGAKAELGKKPRRRTGGEQGVIFGILTPCILPLFRGDPPKIDSTLLSL